jgi:hypothetical protein
MWNEKFSLSTSEIWIQIIFVYNLYFLSKSQINTKTSYAGNVTLLLETLAHYQMFPSNSIKFNMSKCQSTFNSRLHKRTNSFRLNFTPTIHNVGKKVFQSSPNLNSESALKINCFPRYRKIGRFILYKIAEEVPKSNIAQWIAKNRLCSTGFLNKMPFLHHKNVELVNNIDQLT